MKKKKAAYFIVVIALLSAIFSSGGCAPLSEQPLERQPFEKGSSPDNLIGKTHTFLLQFDFPAEQSKADITPDADLESSCFDECYPSGMTCDQDILYKCENTNNDGCMELTEVQCTYGCAGNECSKMPRNTPAQSELLRSAVPIASEQNCTAERQDIFLGTIMWNPQGSLCRKTEFGSAIGNYLLPSDCCQKFYGVTTCVEDGGIQQRGIIEASQYHQLRCFKE